MLVENQTVKVTWGNRNKNWYEDKGYEFTKFGDKFNVAVDDLTDGSHVKVDVVCDYCGDIVHVAWRDYRNYKYDKYSCKHCRQKKTSENTLKQRQDYLYNRAMSVCNENGYTLLTHKSDIKTAETRVEYLCPKHGINETKIYTLMLGHGCPKCAYEEKADMAKHNPDFVEKRIAECGGVLLNKKDYDRWLTKNLIVKCPMCGEPFVTSYNSFTHHGGQFCSNCTRSHSVGENKIEEYLNDNNILFEREYRFDGCKDKISLPFDFYLPDYNMAIEYQGTQHYEPVDYFGGKENLEYVQKHDNIKSTYCEENAIYLLVIPYWDFDFIDEILEETLNLHEDIV